MFHYPGRSLRLFRLQSLFVVFYGMHPGIRDLSSPEGLRARAVHTLFERELILLFPDSATDMESRRSPDRAGIRDHSQECPTPLCPATTAARERRDRRG